MSRLKPYPKWDNLSLAWRVLDDLSMLPDKQISPEDKTRLDAARHIVNKVQVRVYEAEKKRAAGSQKLAAQDPKAIINPEAD